MALLTPDLVVRAAQMNPYYHRRLGWPILRPTRDIASAEFAYVVARYQRNATGRLGRGVPLRVDGILGPKTWAHMNGRVWRPALQRHLIVAGEPVAVPFGVVTFEDPEGMSFYGQPCWLPRTDPSGAGINAAVLHWDECVSAHHCFAVLMQRRLSVHLMVDGDGTVYQALDLAEARAWHAKVTNERSIGIEIQNPVHVDGRETPLPQRAVVDAIHPHDGSPYQHFDFYDVQKQRVGQLVEVLCDTFKIPRRLPEHTPGEVVLGLAAENFSGVLGHYHVSLDKIDPGTTLWLDLQRMWSAAAASTDSPPDAVDNMPEAGA